LAEGPERRMRVWLVTGRSIYQGTGKEKGKLGPDYQEAVTSCFMDPEDARELGLRDGDPVRVTTSFGSLVLRARVVKEGRQRGVVFVPYGPWASMLVDPETHGTGMPSLKGVEATVEPAPGEEPMGLLELLAWAHGARKRPLLPREVAQGAR